MGSLPLFSDDYLLARWKPEFDEYLASGEDDTLRHRLLRWDHRDSVLTETQLESQFIYLFFKETWAYWGTGEKAKEKAYCLYAQYGVDNAGQTGNKGTADLALGWWLREDAPPVPQVLCEFKDIRSGLDAPQKRKGNDRTPVKQCFDYLKHAFDQTDSHSSITPTWGIVTDMNEFRIYARNIGDAQFQQFFIKANDNRNISLIDDGEEATFQRFLFWKMFQLDMLLTLYGKSSLEKLLEDQWVHEIELEKGFYREYQGYRESVFKTVVRANPDFHATRGKLVKLTQRFLDRCIFILFCEDMGHALDFPTDLLRDMLSERSKDPYYDPESVDIWDLVKRLFRSMRDGGPFPPDHKINRFNGGLFEPLPELEELMIPNKVFCAKGQGDSIDTLAAHGDTLLYLAAHYNFGSHGSTHQRTITLYALGRIFEQSITDLEYMEAEAEARESIASLSKRKRDGVYYTPEKVTKYIVEETVGKRLSDIRFELAFEFGVNLSEHDLEQYRNSLNNPKKYKKVRASAVSRHISKIDAYEEALNRVKVLDPACGSGAFLIQALQLLLDERHNIANERARITGQDSLFDDDANIRSILSNNLFGVDINPESVEITQLSLWLNTALPGKPLSNLDDHIRCGNSLVGSDIWDFYQIKHPDALFSDLDEQARENVNVFDWEEAFPEVLGPNISEDEQGFDCIVGNPPYVKLQHFRKLKPEESDYYIEGTSFGGQPIYESTRTGNFDLYLPFIERGLSLLNHKGRMGYIAPSLWLKNEYGLGLRKKMKRLRYLDRWIDFKSYQVFSEATTYTALQFFRGQPSDRIHFFLAADGDIAAINWAADSESIIYGELPVEDAWNLQARDEHNLILRLSAQCTSLEEFCAGIMVGIQTSADSIYHFQRVAPGKYRTKGSQYSHVEYEIEDAIMHPLVSGPEAKRYQRPSTDIYLLFPYIVEDGRSRLFTDVEMNSSFPKAWAYLKKHEAVLRSRERKKMDKDDSWWAYNYPKNLDKQELAKLGVAQTVPGMRVFADEHGEFYFNNVRVNGILSATADDLFYLLGILNSKVIDFVFRHTAKPKGGGYFEANKQYIGPLPIPVVTEKLKADIGKRAKRLQELHTSRRDTMAKIQRRLNCEQCIDEIREANWFWADVSNLRTLKDESPEGLTGRERMAWAKKEFIERLAGHIERIEPFLSPGITFSVEHDHGEVRFLAGGFPIITVYEHEATAPFLATQWRQIARKINVTDKFKAKTLVKSLLSLRSTRNNALSDQIVEMDAMVQKLDGVIDNAERAMNELVYRLYKLSEDEIKLVQM